MSDNKDDMYLSTWVISVLSALAIGFFAGQVKGCSSGASSMQKQAVMRGYGTYTHNGLGHEFKWIDPRATYTGRADESTDK